MIDRVDEFDWSASTIEKKEYSERKGLSERLPGLTHHTNSLSLRTFIPSHFTLAHHIILLLWSNEGFSMGSNGISFRDPASEVEKW